MDPQSLLAWAEFQHGVITRGQARDAGLSDRQVEWRIANGRWQRRHRGVYLVEPGRNDRAMTLSAAVLACGDGAALSHPTAAHQLGLERREPRLIDITVPQERRIATPAGVRLHRSRSIALRTEGRNWPTRTTVEHTVLDVAGLGTPDEAVAIAALACQKGLTWYQRLLDVLANSPRHRWRGLLAAALEDIGNGAHSTLEVRFVRDVARPHGLPVGRLQLRTDAGTHDVGYKEYRVLIELDGLFFHSGPTARLHDVRRDLVRRRDQAVRARRRGRRHLLRLTAGRTTHGPADADRAPSRRGEEC